MPDQVWPWVAQLGQGRGGFYSYDRLENLVGCEIESADRIHPEWQDVRVGDPFRLHPKLALVVAEVNPGHSLVVDGRARPGEPAPPYDFTWAFVVRRHPGLRTRLIVRERYGYTTPASRLVVEPLAAGSALMTRKMLHGIRQRVEAARAGRTPAGRVGHQLSRTRSCLSRNVPTRMMMRSMRAQMPRPPKVTSCRMPVPTLPT